MLKTGVRPWRLSEARSASRSFFCTRAAASWNRSKTSGQVVVYDAKGALLFSGGITAARGHMGDNAGRDRITALLRGDTAASGES